MFNFELSSLGDTMLEEQVKQRAKEQGISELELIKQYIKTGLENEEDTQKETKMTSEERIKLFKEDVEEDKRLGRYKKQGNFEELLEKLQIKTIENW